MKNIIYFDNAATTKPIKKVVNAFAVYHENEWYNPSALYKSSALAYTSIENTRKKVLKSLNAYDGQVVFTSGGTESNNLAILSSVNKKKRCHFITSAYEHDAVYRIFKSLEIEHDVTYIMPNEHGIINTDDIIKSITDQTVLVSIMHVNNETGALNDINSIANMVKSKNPNILVHSDGVQAFLKTDITLSDAIDFYSISAHKVGGLKGSGALYAKKGVVIKPIVLGGGQEKGLRSGTENTFGIKAFALAIDYFDNDLNHISALRESVLSGLNKISHVVINSPIKENDYSPYILNASITGVNGQTLLHALEEKGFYIGIGSACSSKKRTSRIHQAIGLNKKESESTIRISFNRDNTQEQVESLVKAISTLVEDLRIFKRR